jgi:hypothetical protein
LRIWLKNPALVNDLRDYLRRCNCDVERDGHSALHVELNGPVRSPEWARMQLQAYVSVWHALHPQSETELFA